MSNRDKEALKKQKKLAAQRAEGKQRLRLGKDELEMNNIYTEDPSKLVMVNELSSLKLLEISEKFDLFPGGDVDLQQFVDIMVETMKDTVAS